MHIIMTNATPTQEPTITAVLSSSVNIINKSQI